MKKIRIFCLLLCLLVLCSGFPVFASGMDDLSLTVTAGSHSLDGTKPYLNEVRALSNCQAALLYEVTTDTILYSYNADVSMQPTSLAKIMTALVVLENSNLSDLVTVKQTTLNTIPKDAAQTELLDGEVITVEELLYCMLVDSANDATVVLAEHVSGTQSAFVEKMNERAAQIGCVNTNFVNVHGLVQEGNRSTARDLAKILLEALQNPAFTEIFQTKYHSIPATNKAGERYIITGNYLMTREKVQIYYDSRVTGGRTGVDSNDKRNIAVTAESGDMKMISLVMGSTSKLDTDGYTVLEFGSFDETTELLNYGFNGMAATQVMYTGQAVKQYPVANGECALVVGPQVDVATVLPQGMTSEDLVYRYTDISAEIVAPVEKGQKISTVEVFLNDICLAQEDLYALNSVGVAPDEPLRVPIVAEGGLKPVLLVIIILVPAVLLFLIGTGRLRRHRRRVKKGKMAHMRGR